MPRSSGRICVVIFLALILAFSFQSAQAQIYTIELQGLTWEHLNLRVLIVLKTDQVWWRSYFLNSTLRALNEWNYALQNFSGYGSQFSFLSRVQFVPTISSKFVAGFDIFLTWVEKNNGSEVIGTSQAIFNQPYFIVNNTVYLGARLPTGSFLSETDSQNVAVHEMGHTLGLGHSNAAGDVMDPKLTLGGSIIPMSTLDAYGVWQVLKWLGSFPPQRQQAYPGLFASLPASIPYDYLPLGYTPASFSQPWGILTDILQNYFGFASLAVGVVVIIVALIRWRRSLIHEPSPPPAPLGLALNHDEIPIAH
ncbi:matrixin family metalloprotease [Candidatus Bathyarchaeota archaeon]|nr:matrixin family metalloprotease [Candidatus Bathyarchaeota archaeon]